MPTEGLTQLLSERGAQALLLAGTTVLAIVGWWVQRVRYPSFRAWPEHEFRSRHARYTFGVSWWVIPAMLAQLAGVSWLVLRAENTPWIVLNVLLVAATIGPTLLISGPIHGKLSKGKDLVQIDRLIRTNYPRTIAWSIHALLAAMWMTTSR